MIPPALAVNALADEPPDATADRAPDDSPNDNALTRANCAADAGSVCDAVDRPDERPDASADRAPDDASNDSVADGRADFASFVVANVRADSVADGDSFFVANWSTFHGAVAHADFAAHADADRGAVHRAIWSAYAAAVLHANDKTNGGPLKRSDACAHVPAHAGAQWPSFDTPHGLADDDDAADARAGMRRWRV